MRPARSRRDQRVRRPRVTQILNKEILRAVKLARAYRRRTGVMQGASDLEALSVLQDALHEAYPQFPLWQEEADRRTRYLHSFMTHFSQNSYGAVIFDTSKPRRHPFRTIDMQWLRLPKASTLSILSEVSYFVKSYPGDTIKKTDVVVYIGSKRVSRDAGKHHRTRKNRNHVRQRRRRTS